MYESHNSRDCSMSTLRALYLDDEHDYEGEEEHEEEEWAGEEPAALPAHSGTSDPPTGGSPVLERK